MRDELENCWQIMQCGRQPGGENVHELGVCPAAELCLGHSCWVVAGTMCGGELRGTFAKKAHNCIACPVFREYNRASGKRGREVAVAYPDEQKRYLDAILRLTHRSGEKE